MSTESRYREKDSSARAGEAHSFTSPGAFGGTRSNNVLRARKGRNKPHNSSRVVTVRLPLEKIAAPSEMGFTPPFSERSLRHKARFRLTPPFLPGPLSPPRSTSILNRDHKRMSHV